MTTRLLRASVLLFTLGLLTSDCASGDGSVAATAATAGGGGTGADGGAAGATTGAMGSTGSGGASGSHSATSGASGSGGGGASGVAGSGGSGAIAGSGGAAGTSSSGNLTLCVLNAEPPFDPCATPSILNFGTVPVNTTEMRMFRYDNDTGKTVSFTNVAASGSMPLLFTTVTAHYTVDPQNPNTPIRTAVTLPTLVGQGETLYFEVSFMSDQSSGPLPADSMLVTAAIGSDSPQLLAVPLVGQKSGCPNGLGDCDQNSANGCETDISSSLPNCGGCAMPCAPANAAAMCSQGECLLGACSAPFDNCDMDDANGCEADLFNSLVHCGSCGVSCEKANTNAFCNGGNCNIIGCSTGFADCNLSAADGCETNVNTDLQNCGGCNLPCALANASETCINGTCTLGACSAGYVDCDMNIATGCEVDTLGDPNNCGGCAQPCTVPHATPSCDNGMCGIAVCAAGFADCNHDATDGCEINLNTTLADCGACDHACDFANAGESCVGGTCIIGSCQTGFSNCNGNDLDGCEANLNTSLANCGGCNLACALPHGTEQCVGGSCEVMTCDPGYADCDNLPANGCETNTNTSAGNCGGCDLPCSIPNANAQCIGGVCTQSSCVSGTADCTSAPGCETNIDTSLTNCGGCNTLCDIPHASETCVAGHCNMGTCAAGYADCNVDPTDGCEVNINTTLTSCGGCGTVCNLDHASESCVGGVCTLGACNDPYQNCDNNPANGCETNTDTSLNNCGGCGTLCSFPNAQQVCLSGTCLMVGCQSGFQNCDGNNTNGCEINTNTNVNNCGGCNIKCLYANAGAQCLGGTCAMGTCNPGFKDCDGNPANGCEVNINTSLGNCGACGTNCDLANASETCVSGTCTLGTCSSGYANCDNDATNGCEVNTTTSLTNCGGCGTPCNLANASESCLGGTCVLSSCDTGFANCDSNNNNGCEVATSTDLNNCGGCNIHCSFANAASQCLGGTCVMGTCGAGFKDCNGSNTDGCEVNTNTSLANCGGCNINCDLANASETCVSGTCTLGTCTTGFKDCDGSPTNGCESSSNTDVNNCGTCGHVCSAANGTPGCSNGACTTTGCGTGFADCDGSAGNGCEVNTTNNVSNCGVCGHACSTANGTAACVSSSCVTAACNAGFKDCDGLAVNGCEINTNTNPLSCGTCGNVCTIANGTAGCSAGACTVASCNTGWADCDGNPANGCETNTLTSTSSCGTCGHTCTTANGTPSCSNGTCAVGTCNAGFKDCNGNATDGCEINSNTNVNNCGGCGTVCSAANGTAQCGSGTCSVASCNSGFANCNNQYIDGCEVNLTNDGTHCGTCTTNCATTCATNVAATSCSAGACSITACTANNYNIDGTCSDGCECTAGSGGLTCAAPTDLGTLNLAGSATFTTNVVPSGSERWFKVTFTGNTSTSYHPHVRFTANPNAEFQFDVESNCVGGVGSCGVEGGVSTGKTDWEVFNGAGSAGYYNPIPAVGTGGVVYIRVFRKTGAPVTCNNFTIAISN